MTLLRRNALNLAEYLMVSVGLFLVFVIAYRWWLFIPGKIFAPFMISEGSEGFLQLRHMYLAMKNGGSLVWDDTQFLNILAGPITPLFSPWTWTMLTIFKTFGIDSLAGQANAYSCSLIAVQLSCGLTMYRLLKHLSLHPASSFLGSVAYSYNFFTSEFGIRHGPYRMLALMIIPLLFGKVSKDLKRSSVNISQAVSLGALIGICLLCNGDVKPTTAFLVVLIFFGMAVRSQSISRSQVARYFVMAACIGLCLASVQLCGIYEACQESVRSRWGANLWEIPSNRNPANTILGHSQNPTSLLFGFLFPNSYFDTFADHKIMSLSSVSYNETRFSFSPILLLVSMVGLVYRTRLHRMWLIVLCVFGFFLLGYNTPFFPVWALLSKIGQWRYPTRAAIVIYFVLSIYVAYGFEILLGRCRPLSRQWLNSYKHKLLKIGGIVVIFLVLSAMAATHVLNPPQVKILVPLVLLFSSVSFVLLMFSGRAHLAFATQSQLRSFDRKCQKYLGYSFIGAFVLFLWLIGVEGASHQMHMNVFGFLLHKELMFLCTAVFGFSLVLHGYAKSYRHFRILLGFLCVASVIATVMLERTRGKIPEEYLRDPEVVFKDPVELKSELAEPDFRLFRVMIQRDQLPLLSTHFVAPESGVHLCCTRIDSRIRNAALTHQAPMLQNDILSLVLDRPHHTLWKLFGVRYWFNGKSFEENEGVLRPGFWRPSSQVVSLANFKDQIKKENFSLEGPVIFHEGEGDPIPPGRRDEARIDVNTLLPGLGVFEVSSSQPGYFVFSEVWSRMWRAFVDGIEVPNFIAYGFMQAVRVDQGTHVVQFKFDVFQSKKMKLFLCLSILTALGTLITIAYRVRKFHE